MANLFFGEAFPIKKCVNWAAAGRYAAAAPKNPGRYAANLAGRQKIPAATRPIWLEDKVPVGTLFNLLLPIGMYQSTSGAFTEPSISRYYMYQSTIDSRYYIAFLPGGNTYREDDTR